MTKTKILVLAANPQNTGRLQLDEEVRSIQTELQRARYRDRFELISQWAVRADDLSSALLEHKPQIVHFAGHGQGTPAVIADRVSADSVDRQLRSRRAGSERSMEATQRKAMVDTALAPEGLMLVDHQGRAKLVTIHALAGLFNEFKEHVKCVVLNACYSETLAMAIHEHIDCVVGMNNAIGDEAAIKFATGFYRTVMAGEHFERAYKLALNSLDLASIPESLTPVFHNRRECDDPFGLRSSVQALSPSPQNTPEYGEPVGKGLNALTELMRIPEVQKSVTKFRIVFQVTCEQIDVVANYKALHDLLHTLEFQCYNSIVQESKRFPDDERTLEILEEHELTLQNLLREMQKVIARETIATNELKWLSDVEKAQIELRNAIDTSDRQHLQATIRLLNRVLAIQPSRIDANLTRSAQSLKLPDLVEALTFIAEKLTGTYLDQTKLQQFQEGVEVLAELEQKLTAKLNRHNSLQELDLELRRIADQKPDELETFWSGLRADSEKLLNEETGQWAIDFQQDIQNLDEALRTQNPSKITRFFRLYRRRASNHFFEVDVDLKRLCEELREVGEPLASVLRMIE